LTLPDPDGSAAGNLLNKSYRIPDIFTALFVFSLGPETFLSSGSEKVTVVKKTPAVDAVEFIREPIDKFAHFYVGGFLRLFIVIPASAVQQAQHHDSPGNCTADFLFSSHSPAESIGSFEDNVSVTALQIGKTEYDRLGAVETFFEFIDGDW
jgi:hypothetical protein